jgi:hypothetical protein
VGKAPPIDAASVSELQRLREVERQFKRLQMEHDLLKNRLRGQPRPIVLETRGATLPGAGEWPSAFWRHDPVKKPGPGEAADPMLVAFHTTPFRKVIRSESPSGIST